MVHAIHAHHNDVEPKTIVACLVQAADAISAARPGARRKNLENYIKRLEKLEEVTSSFPGVEKSFAIQAGREVRIIVKPEVVSEDEMTLLAREIAQRIENELEYPGQIKVHLLREVKIVEYAKIPTSHSTPPPLGSSQGRGFLHGAPPKFLSFLQFLPFVFPKNSI